MLLSESEVIERIESPLNLMNRLRSSLNSSPKAVHPSFPPSSSEIVKDLEEKLKFGSVKQKAAAIMSASLDELKNKLPELPAKQLSSVAESMSKIISNVQVRDNDSEKLAQVIIYAPTIVSEENFNIVDIREKETV